MLKNWIGKPFSQVWAMRVILNEVLIVVLSKGNKILQRLDLVYSFSLTRYIGVLVLVYHTQRHHNQHKTTKNFLHVVMVLFDRNFWLLNIYRQ